MKNEKQKKNNYKNINKLMYLSAYCQNRCQDLYVYVCALDNMYVFNLRCFIYNIDPEVLLTWFPRFLNFCDSWRS